MRQTEIQEAINYTEFLSTKRRLKVKVIRKEGKWSREKGGRQKLAGYSS